MEWWQDMPLPHRGEEIGKHVFGVDAVMKAMLSGLDRAGNIVEGRMKMKSPSSRDSHRESV
jgi:hypothetical protein